MDKKIEVKVEKKVIETKRPKVKGKNKQQIAIIALLTLLILALGSIMYLTYQVSDLQEPTNTTDNIVQEEATEETEQVVEEETEEVESEPVEEAIVYPSYKLDLTNSGYIQVPQGWKVSKISSKSSQLTTTQMTDYLNPVNHGYWPMYEGVDITLTNGTSTIEMGRTVQFIPGGVGFVANVLDSSYEIVLEPTIDDSVAGASRSKFGIARKLTSGRYEYVHIVKDSGGLGDGTGHIDGNVGPAMYYFTFTGSNTDKNVVEVFFKNACMIDSSKLCGSL